ncbi:hypothetical protein D3C73_755520 [compost metagenome]
MFDNIRFIDEWSFRERIIIDHTLTALFHLLQNRIWQMIVPGPVMHRYGYSVLIRTVFAFHKQVRLGGHEDAASLRSGIFDDDFHQGLQQIAQPDFLGDGLRGQQHGVNVQTFRIVRNSPAMQELLGADPSDQIRVLLVHKGNFPLRPPDRIIIF